MSNVMWSPTVNINQAPGTVIIGSPGSGKSVWEDNMVGEYGEEYHNIDESEK